MNKIKMYCICLLALAATLFSSCKAQEEEPNTNYTPPVVNENTPQIVSMNFAESEKDFLSENYLQNIQSDKKFYLGFQINDEDKDAKKNSPHDKRFLWLYNLEWKQSFDD